MRVRNNGVRKFASLGVGIKISQGHETLKKKKL